MERGTQLEVPEWHASGVSDVDGLARGSLNDLYQPVPGPTLNREDHL